MNKYSEEQVKKTGASLIENHKKSELINPVLEKQLPSRDAIIDIEKKFALSPLGIKNLPHPFGCGRFFR